MTCWLRLNEEQISRQGRRLRTSSASQYLDPLPSPLNHIYAETERSHLYIAFSYPLEDHTLTCDTCSFKVENKKWINNPFIVGGVQNCLNRKCQGRHERIMKRYFDPSHWIAAGKRGLSIVNAAAKSFATKLSKYSDIVWCPQSNSPTLIWG